MNHNIFHYYTTLKDFKITRHNKGIQNVFMKNSMILCSINCGIQMLGSKLTFGSQFEYYYIKCVFSRIQHVIYLFAWLGLWLLVSEDGPMLSQHCPNFAAPKLETRQPSYSYHSWNLKLQPIKLTCIVKHKMMNRIIQLCCIFFTISKRHH